MRTKSVVIGDSTKAKTDPFADWHPEKAVPRDIRWKIGIEAEVGEALVIAVLRGVPLDTYSRRRVARILPKYDRDYADHLPEFQAEWLRRKAQEVP